MIQTDNLPVVPVTDATSGGKGVFETLKGLGFEDAVSSIANGIVQFSFKLVIAVLVFYIGKFIIKKLYGLVFGIMINNKVDASLTTFVLSLIRMVLYFILIITIIGILGIETSSFLALFASAGVAIGMALSGTLQNFAGGVLILLLKPFKVGDYIKEDSNGNEGTVVEIQLFYTKLATPDNRIIVLPNGTLANTSMTNVTEAAVRRLDIYVGIAYDSSIKQAREVLIAMLQADETTLKDKELRVFVDELAESCIRLDIRCWVNKEDYWETKWRLTEETKYALDAAGIVIPFPQLDVHQKLS